MSGTTTSTSTPTSSPNPNSTTGTTVQPVAAQAPDPLTATDPNLVVGIDGTLDLSAIVNELASSMRAGDTLTLSSATVLNGEVVTGSNGDLIYEPINSKLSSGGPTTTGYDLTQNSPGNGSGILSGGGSGIGSTTTVDNSATTTAGFTTDTLAYTVTDAAGYSVQGTANITIDPGPVAANGTYEVGHGQTVNLYSYINSLITPGMAGDTETVGVNSVSEGTVKVEKGLDPGSQAPTNEKIDYTAPNVGESQVGFDLTSGNSGTADLSYTATDQYGDTATAQVTLLIDPGPAATDPTLAIGSSGTIDLTQVLDKLATPGLSGDTLTLTAASGGSYGVVEQAANGDWVYFGKFAQATDTISYTVSDQLGDVTTGTATIDLDPGPTAANGTITLAAGQTANLTSYLQSLVTPGISGDTEAFTSVSTEAGRASISGGESSSETGAGKMTGPQVVNYTAPASGTDELTYTVVNQNDEQATGSVAVTVDPGPVVTKASSAIVVGHGQTVNLASEALNLVSPGLSGDTVQLVSASAENGQASVVDTKFAPALEYTAPARGSDLVTFGADETFISSVTTTTTGNSTTYAENYGTSATNGGELFITVDPGPATTTAKATVDAGHSVDLTNTILAADTPGLAGDQLTITADGTLGTLGSVSLVNGDLVYTASGAGLQNITAGGSAADSFTYTVSDQYGDTAMGTVDLNVLNPSSTPTVIDGGPYGNSTIQGVNGPEQINAFGTGNTIYANGGSGTIDAALGNATIYAGGGNLTMNLAGYNDVVSGGNGNEVISGSQGNATITLGNGNDSIDAGGYANVITAGSGNDQIVGGAGNETITGGGGADTITLGGYANVVTLNGGNNVIAGGQGSDTFDLTGGTSSLALGGSNEMVFLNGANATINDLGSGLDVKVAGGGSDAIENFASDPSGVVDLIGGIGGYTSAAQVFAALTPDGHGGSMLMLGQQGSIDFVGASLSQLHATNFHIG